MKKRSGIIGTKIGNSSYFSEQGRVIPVSIVKIDECVVSRVRSNEKDGYTALQLASIDKNVEINKIKKPQRKIFASLKIKPKKILKEFKVTEDSILELAGAMKRHNFHGLRASHGVSVSHRSHGSTGQNQDPGRVFKGKKMAGHMGVKQVTKQNLKLIDVDQDNNLLIIKGSIPGKKNSIVFIKDAIKKN